jgi:hypothetical protein
MLMNWQEEFEAAMKSFGFIEPEPVEYRFYYDEFGHITMCSMQNHSKDTEYVIVNKEQYDNYYKYAVDTKTKKLKVVVASNPGVSVQLKRSTKGWRVVNHHAGIVLEDNEDYDLVEYYDTNN